MKNKNKKTIIFKTKKSYDDAVDREDQKIVRSEDEIERLKRLLWDYENSSSKKRTTPPKKHTKVEVAYLDVYDYRKKLALWRKHAGDNLTDQGCDKCHGKQYERTILLEDGRHICWFCWIRKPDDVETTYKKVVSSKPKKGSKVQSKEVKKEKPKVVNGISTDQKHTVVTTAEFDEYNYQRRLRDWRKKAGYNEKPHQCFKCKEDDCYTSILLDNHKHVCYTCWIKKPSNSSNKKKVKK